MARKPAHLVPACADCGYERTGLNSSDGSVPPCPECGGSRVDVPWVGWRTVVVRSVLPVWGASLVLMGVPAVLEPLVGPLPLVVFLQAMGAMITLTILAMAPFLAAGFSIAGRTCSGRPGQFRIAVVALALSAAGVGVIGWLCDIVVGLLER
ncbi:MAG: hypothetical protein R3B68_08005 [Phycisphaerales bacterium]